MNGRPITAPERKRILELRIAGETIASIAAEIDRSESVVWRVLRSTGRTTTRRHLTAEQHGYILQSDKRTGQLASELGFDPRTIRRARAAQRKKGRTR